MTSNGTTAKPRHNHSTWWQDQLIGRRHNFMRLLPRATSRVSPFQATERALSQMNSSSAHADMIESDPHRRGCIANGRNHPILIATAMG